jgi:hypothetical protein
MQRGQVAELLAAGRFGRRVDQIGDRPQRADGVMTEIHVDSFGKHS